MSTEAIGDRLDRLEHQNRRLRQAAVGLLAGLVALGGMAIFARGRGGRTLEAQRLVIRDKEGRLRGSFGVDADGLPSLKVYDRRGLEQIELGVPSEDMATIALSDHGVNRVLLDTSIEGTTALRLYDQSARPRTAFVIRPDGSTEMCLGQGRQAVTLALRPGGQAVVLTTDAYGRSVERPLATSGLGLPPLGATGDYPLGSMGSTDSETSSSL